MKPLVSIAALLLISVFALGQTEKERVFKPFKVDVSAGFALPVGSGGMNGGGVFAIEPKYAITDQFVLGLRMEGAALARNITTDLSDEIEGDAQANGSYLLTGDYLFNNNKFRPFAGVGAGYFNVAAAPIEDQVTEDDVLTAGKFGYMFRGGFETGHFRFGIEYNLVGSTSFSPKNNYISFKVGGFFGGGRLKK